ncbi:hypothetical protein [Steroidobacter denitrificans]|nr:hypothetical protein [Steroidobacter denitrificans]
MQCVHNPIRRSKRQGLLENIVYNDLNPADSRATALEFPIRREIDERSTTSPDISPLGGASRL